MTPDIREIAAEVLRLSEAATPGPWEHDEPRFCGPDGQWGVWHSDSGGPVALVGDPYPRGENHPYENMQFIAYTRTAAPALAEALLAALEREQALVEAVRENISVNLSHSELTFLIWFALDSDGLPTEPYLNARHHAVVNAFRAIVTAATAREERS